MSPGYLLLQRPPENRRSLNFGGLVKTVDDRSNSRNPCLANSPGQIGTVRLQNTRLKISTLFDIRESTLRSFRRIKLFSSPRKVSSGFSPSDVGGEEVVPVRVGSPSPVSVGSSCVCHRVGGNIEVGVLSRLVSHPRTCKNKQLINLLIYLCNNMKFLFTTGRGRRWGWGWG